MTDPEIGTDPEQYSPAEAGETARRHMAPMLKAIRETQAGDDDDAIDAAIEWRLWVEALVERSNRP